MMKQFISACLGLIVFAAPVWADHHNLVDLVLEKKVMGQLYRGNLPMINLNNYAVHSYDHMNMASGPMLTVRQPIAEGQQAYMKQYEVVNTPGHFGSLIQIRELGSGRVRGHLSVGRRIQRLLPHPNKHRMYVLCGGYFGSIWEIDTQKDIVLRKLPTYASESPLWNPKDMTLMDNGQTLAVSSDRMQFIDIESGELREEGASGQKKIRSSGYNAHKVRVRTAYSPAPAVSRLFYMAGRNTDYINMIDRETLKTVGILPVDFNVDDVVLSPDRKRLFAYNGRFGQISVIELNPRSEKQFSTIKRFRDKRFMHNPPMKLAAAAGRVFLWDGVGTVRASIEEESLFERVNLPSNVQLREPNERVWVSKPAHQRYYIREGQLFAEYVDNAPSALSKAIDLGGEALDLALSPDRHQLYVLVEYPADVAQNTSSNAKTSPYKLVHLDAETHSFQRQLNLSMRPLSLTVSPSGNHLMIADADEGLLQAIHAQSFQTAATYKLDMGLDSPFQITLFHPGQTQVIEVELPRYMTDVVRVAQ